ncbi:hypothetical protein SUGI_1107690 [Cryptomeria japonica]|nr:hypothetical protein SUGI_1107690 [Cryptomeria japonica]
MWRPKKISISMMSMNKNWLKAKVKILHSDLNLYIYNIYGLVKTEEKKALWDDLGHDFIARRFIVVEDFNGILDPSEKSGGHWHVSQTRIDFKAFVQANDMIDIKSSNGLYT